MICQSCGECMPLKDTYIVAFTSASILLRAKLISCKKCAKKLEADCRYNFDIYILNRCLSIYNVVGGEPIFKKE